jgi:hypothetical protein
LFTKFIEDYPKITRGIYDGNPLQSPGQSRRPKADCYELFRHRKNGRTGIVERQAENLDMKINGIAGEVALRTAPAGNEVLVISSATI